MAAPPLRLGVLGIGNVARRFAAAVANSPRIALTAAASRDRGKAEAFAREAGFAKAHGSYEALLADPAVEAVYIPLPNSLHAEWAVKAVRAGKHVLCEKPLGVTAEEAKTMFAAADKAGVHLVEAYPYLAQPQTIAMRDLLRRNVIGRLNLVQASFGFALPNPEDNVRLVAELGGGARLDAASYPVSLVRIAAGERPLRALAQATWFKPGVDRTMTATFEFASGLLAQVAASFDTGFHRLGILGGDGGVMITDYANHASPEGLELKLKRGRALDAPFETLRFAGGNGFLAEAEAFAALVAGEAWTGATAAESIDVMLMIDAISESLKTGGWASLAA